MLVRNLVLTLCLLALPWLTGCGTTQQSFDSPQAAVTALEHAVAADDRDQFRQLLGPRSDELKSGDAEQDRGDFVAFAYKLNEKTQIQTVSDTEALLLVGSEAWPFPVPIVKSDGRWRFDTDAGIDELTTRRIGADELAIIDAANAFIDAEAQYQSEDRNGDGVREFTPRLMSTPGTRDGLYWDTGENEQPSPLGPVMAMAMTRTDAAGNTFPFYGYFFKALTRQGPDAPGGAMDYAENGRLTKGIAAVAFPAEYGRTGIMTFIFSIDGEIYQRDLGAATASVVAALDTFNPGEGWVRVGN